MEVECTEKEDAWNLSRDSVAGILGVLQSENHATPEWNIVEVLELLIDAGHFSAARDLAGKVVGLVAGDGRDRLFRGYEVLCALMEFGDQSRSLEALERLYIEIHNGGHSIADKARIGLLLARALALCVSVGSLSERSMLRARSILSVELDRLATSKNGELEAQVLIELAKCYLHAPTEDAKAAQSLLEMYSQRPICKELSAARSFDLKRVLFQAQRRAGLEGSDTITPESLRTEAQGLGGVTRALTEVVIARVGTELGADVGDEQLERAADIFEANDFLCGAFEVRFTLASRALDLGHNVVADRHWRGALAIAQAGGFLHGKFLALLGLFQSAILGEDSRKAHLWLQIAEQEVTSELALGSAGLNVAAACQIVRDFPRALKIAARCEKFFQARGLGGFQAQAAHIVGTCEAHAGRWNKARLAWARAAALDEQRHAFVSACERHGLVAQAYLMGDVTSLGHLRPVTAKKVARIVESAEATLRSFSELDEAVRIRAKLQTVHAHISVLVNDHVGALRHLSAARTLFTRLGLEYDVAMSDAFTALSMLEVSKASNPALAEEAVMYLQRTLQFFSALPGSPMRWKLLYYLTVAAVLVSQSKSSDHDKMKWRALASGWVREAEREVSQLEGASDAVGGNDGSYSDFSPGLTPAAIDEIKHALGLRDRSRKKREEQSQVPLPSEGYVH
jgi:hypothetical protein